MLYCFRKLIFTKYIPTTTWERKEHYNDMKMSMHFTLRHLPVMLAALMMAPMAHAATSPSLGSATTYAILSGTYTNTVAGTTVNGDIGFTTGPDVAPSWRS